MKRIEEIKDKLNKSVESLEIRFEQYYEQMGESDKTFVELLFKSILAMIEQIDTAANGESVHRTITENPDSIEIGTPGKGGVIKVYGNSLDKDDFEKRIDGMIEARKYANAQVQVELKATPV